MVVCLVIFIPILILLQQSLLTPMSFLIYSHRDSVLDVLASFEVDSVQPPKSGLEVFISGWMENAEGLQGLWSQRLKYYFTNVHQVTMTNMSNSDLAICSILSSDKTEIFNIPVKGDLIIKPETANGKLKYFFSLLSALTLYSHYDSLKNQKHPA